MILTHNHINLKAVEEEKRKAEVDQAEKKVE